MLSVLSLFILFPVVFCVTFWSSFAYARTIECFHSRGQHLCKFIGTKESVCIRKEFNSHRTGLGHQHGRRFIVLGHHYMAAMTSCENTLYYIFYLYLPLKAIRFFCCCITKKVRGWRKLTFKTTAFSKVIRAKIFF